jgi:hypothetical protein
MKSIAMTSLKIVCFKRYVFISEPRLKESETIDKLPLSPSESGHTSFCCQWKEDRTRREQIYNANYI